MSCLAELSARKLTANRPAIGSPSPDVNFEGDPMRASISFVLLFFPTGSRPAKYGTKVFVSGVLLLLSLLVLGSSAFAQATLTPATLSFGKQGLNSTNAAKTVTLTNNDSTAITLSGETITGTNASEFAISATTCGTSLAAHTSCTISVTFTPAATGAMTATLSVADSATNSPQTISLAGTGVAQATTSVTTLAFGKQVLNSTSAAKTVTLTNNDSTAITLSGETITGTNASEFAISATTCGTSLAAHTSCTISVTFTPAATGAMTATLSIADCATNSPQAVSLTGTGVAPIPTHFRADISDGTTGQLFVSWDSMNGATYYNLRRSTNPNSGYTSVAACSGLANIKNTNTTGAMRACRDGGLIVGTFYYYQVQACYSNGCSGFSASASNVPVASNCTAAQMPSMSGVKTLPPIRLLSSVVDPAIQFLPNDDQYAAYAAPSVPRRNLLLVTLPGSGGKCGGGGPFSN